MRKIISSIVVFFLFISTLMADEIEDYARIYHKQCATCHGNNGDGNGRASASLSPAATDFTSAESRANLSFDKIKVAIRDGVAGTAMSAYGKRFDDKSLTGLSKYIQQQFMGEKTPVDEVIENVTVENNGQALYVKHCSACHGDNGNTAVWARNALNPAPRNFTSPEANVELSLERMLTSVTYGRPGTAMMSFEKRLNAAEIQSVVKYIRQTFMQREENQAADLTQTPQIAADAVDMTLPFPDELQGNVTAGEEFFQNNCFTCHGKEGDGKGPRADFNIPRPRNFLSAESRRILNRPRLFKSVSHGKPRTVMSAWSTVLSAQQIADVAEYVFQKFVLGQAQKKKF